MYLTVIIMTKIPNTDHFLPKIAEIPSKKLASTGYRHVVRPPEKILDQNREGLLQK